MSARAFASPPVIVECRMPFERCDARTPRDPSVDLINLPQRLDLIAHEADGYDEHVLHAGMPQTLDLVLQIGLHPRQPT